MVDLRKCGQCSRRGTATRYLLWGCLNLHIAEQKLCDHCFPGMIRNLAEKSNGKCYQCSPSQPWANWIYWTINNPVDWGEGWVRLR